MHWLNFARLTRPNQSIGVKLLIDIRRIFDENNLESITTKDLLKFLVALETSNPWADWWEKSLKDDNIRGPAAKLSRRLKKYGIEPKDGRFSDEHTKGFQRAYFEDAWRRYCWQAA